MDRKNIFSVFNSFLNFGINKKIANVIIVLLIIFLNINFSQSTDLDVDTIINEFQMYK